MSRDGDDHAWAVAGRREVGEQHVRATLNAADFRIPDRNPEGGPFEPASAERVVFAGHGSWQVPWPVFLHFLDAIATSGDIVGDAMSATEPQPERGILHRSRMRGRWAVPSASNPPPPNRGAGDLELILLEPGATPIELIRTLRGMTGFGLMDSRALLETCPSVVMTGLDRDQATELRAALRSAGATADVRPSQPGASISE